MDEMGPQEVMLRKLRKKIAGDSYLPEEYIVKITNGKSALSSYVTILGDEIVDTDILTVLLESFGMETIERFVKMSELAEKIALIELIRDGRKVYVIIETKKHTPEKYIEFACEDVLIKFKHFFKDR